MEPTSTEQFIEKALRIQREYKTGEFGIDIKTLLLTVGIAAVTENLTTIHNVLKQLSKQIEQQNLPRNKED